MFWRCAKGKKIIDNYRKQINISNNKHTGKRVNQRWEATYAETWDGIQICAYKLDAFCKSKYQGYRCYFKTQSAVLCGVTDCHFQLQSNRNLFQMPWTGLDVGQPAVSLWSSFANLRRSTNSQSVESFSNHNGAHRKIFLTSMYIF